MTACGVGVAGGQLRRVAGLEREPDAAVVEEDPRAGDHDVAPPTRRVRLDEGHADAVGVRGAEVDRPTGRGWSGGSGPAVGIDGLAAGEQPARVEQGGAIGRVVEDGRPVVTGPARRLDEEVSPGAVVGVVGEGQPFGDPRRGRREVALRRRGHGPDAVPPHVEGDRVDPVGLRPGQVVSEVQAAADREEGGPDVALVERAPPALGDGGQGRGHAGASHQLAGGETTGPPVVVGARDVGDQRARQRHQRRGREPVGRAPARRLEHVVAAGADRGARAARTSRRRSRAPEHSGRSSRNGIVVWPSSRSRAGSLPLAGEPGRAQRVGCLAGPVDEREEVAAHAAHVLRGDGEHRAGGDGGVGGRATGAKDRGAGARRHVVDGADHAPGGVERGAARRPGHRPQPTRMRQSSIRVDRGLPGRLDPVEALRWRGGGCGRRRPVTSALARASVPTWLSKGPAPSAATTKVTSAWRASGESRRVGEARSRPRRPRSVAAAASSHPALVAAQVDGQRARRPAAVWASRLVTVTGEPVTRSHVRAQQVEVVGQERADAVLRGAGQHADAARSRRRGGRRLARSRPGRRRRGCGGRCRPRGRRWRPRTSPTPVSRMRCGGRAEVLVDARPGPRPGDPTHPS